MAAMIFKAVGAGRPYPDHGRDGVGDWSDVPPRQVRLDELVTTKRTLDLDALLADDSTFFGDLFAHVVEYHGCSTWRTVCTAPSGPPSSSGPSSTLASSRWREAGDSRILG